MDYLWSPWRYQYVSNAGQSEDCVFCALPQTGNDEASYILHRGKFNYLVLNIFPYTSGHLLIIPFSHTAQLAELSKETSV